MSVIFWFSAQNADDSSSLSSGLLRSILSVLDPNWSALSEADQNAKLAMFHTLFRKFGHFSEYVVLGVIWETIGFLFLLKGRNKAIFRALPFVVCLLYAISDEVHQIFVDGRCCELRDTCIDFSGACFGIFCAWCVLKLLLHFRQKKAAKS